MLRGTNVDSPYIPYTDDTAVMSVPSEPPPSYQYAAEHGLAEAGKSAPPKPNVVTMLDLPALTSLNGRRVILASASPRRKQLLEQV